MNNITIWDIIPTNFKKIIQQAKLGLKQGEVTDVILEYACKDIEKSLNFSGWTEEGEFVFQLWSDDWRLIEVSDTDCNKAFKLLQDKMKSQEVTKYYAT